MADETIRDEQGRDIRIYGLVFDPENPLRTTRELLRQWHELETKRIENASEVLPTDLKAATTSLLERTAAVLAIIGPDGGPA